MKKQVIKCKLEKYQIRFKEKSDELDINLGLGLEINLEFFQNEEVKITDRLEGWNPLTVVIKM